ncbi:cytochrome c biogenesis CcdA family protein [Nocardiopsis coralliicola]
MDVGYAAALVGGLLALLSPCSALLLPSFFAYAFRDPGRLLLRTGVFFAGLCTTLVPLGAGSAAVSTLFYGHRGALITVAGVLIIALGAVQILGIGFAWGPAARLQNRFAGGRGAASVFGLGAVYGLAGFCSGPILGAVLTVAATGTPARGALLLACYALGMALPLFGLALLWDRFDLGRKTWLRGRSFQVGRFQVHSGNLASGLIFIGIGVLFLAFDGTASLGVPGMGWAEEAAYLAQGALLGLGPYLDAVLLALGAAVAAAVVLHRWARRRARAQEEAEVHDDRGA